MDQNQLLEKIVKNFASFHVFLKQFLKPPYKVFVDNNITRAEMDVLLLLDDEGEKSMSEISNILQISKPNVTKIINTLYKLKYVERKYNESDRRLIFMKLSSIGKIFLEKQMKEMVSDLKDKLEKCSNEQLELISEIIEKIQLVLKKG